MENVRFDRLSPASSAFDSIAASFIPESIINLSGSGKPLIYILKLNQGTQPFLTVINRER
jgi:hypothetical protein